MKGEKKLADAIGLARCPEPDIVATPHFSIWLLDGRTDAGKRWLKDNLDPNALRWGSAFVVEPRFVEDILRGAVHDGLILSVGSITG